MEIRVNVVAMVLVGLTWLGLRAHAPTPVESGKQWATHLAALEDAFGADPSDKRAVIALIDAYLEEGFPLLAVAALGFIAWTALRRAFSRDRRPSVPPAPTTRP